MTTLTLRQFKERAPLSCESESEICNRAQEYPLLVFTADERFWQRLRRTANAAAGKLVRRRNANDSLRALRLFKPGAVLLDLDIPASSVWDTADALLQDPNAPPLLLLTSRTDQVDFRTAIEAGSLVDKRADPAEVLAQAESAREASDANFRERTAMQQLVIRWLKPFVWSAPGTASLYRFWGINE